MTANSQQPNDVKIFDRPQYLPIYISQIYNIGKRVIRPPTTVWALGDRSSLFKICIFGAESIELTLRAFSIVIDRFRILTSRRAHDIALASGFSYHPSLLLLLDMIKID